MYDVWASRSYNYGGGGGGGGHDGVISPPESPKTCVDGGVGGWNIKH
jgi:hypothetical protein